MIAFIQTRRLRFFVLQTREYFVSILRELNLTLSHALSFITSEQQIFSLSIFLRIHHPFSLPAIRRSSIAVLTSFSCYSLLCISSVLFFISFIISMSIFYSLVSFSILFPQFFSTLPFRFMQFHDSSLPCMMYTRISN